MKTHFSQGPDGLLSGMTKKKLRWLRSQSFEAIPLKVSVRTTSLAFLVCSVAFLSEAHAQSSLVDVDITTLSITELRERMVFLEEQIEPLASIEDKTREQQLQLYYLGKDHLELFDVLLVLERQKTEQIQARADDAARRLAESDAKLLGSIQGIQDSVGE